MLIYHPVMFCCFGIGRRRDKATMFVTWSSCDDVIITYKIRRLAYHSVKFGCCKTYWNGDQAINFSGGLVVEITSSPTRWGQCILVYHLPKFGCYRAYKRGCKIINIFSCEIVVVTSSLPARKGRYMLHYHPAKFHCISPLEPTAGKFTKTITAYNMSKYGFSLNRIFTYQDRNADFVHTGKIRVRVTTYSGTFYAVNNWNKI